MNKNEKLTKKSLIKAVNSVRKKFRDLHNMRSGEELKNVEIFKPITKKLDILIDKGNGIKTEPQKPELAGWKPAAAAIKIEGVPPERKRERIQYYPLNRGTPSKVTERRRGSKMSPLRSQSRRLSQKYDSLKRKNAKYNELLDNLRHNPAFKEEKQTPFSVELDSDDGQRMIVAEPKAKKNSSPPILTGPNTSNQALLSTPSSFAYSLPPQSYLNTSAHGSPKTYKPVSLSPNDREMLRTTHFAGEFDDDDDDDDGDEHKRKKKSGAGITLPDLMRYKKNENISYTYWNEPNELVDRLRLLIASKSAGHSGNTNEIMSIVEELREADIIV